MCASMCTETSSSSPPSGRKLSPSLVAPGTTEPQRGQKQRKKPGDDSKRATSPLCEKLALRTAAYVAYAEPWALRQREQWQWEDSVSGGSALHRTAPDRQPPFMRFPPAHRFERATVRPSALGMGLPRIRCPSTA